MAAWQVRPPRLVTMAPARFITGSQSGLVVSATSTSPVWKAARSRVPPMMRTGPLAILSPMARPVTTGLALPLSA